MFEKTQLARIFRNRLLRALLEATPVSDVELERLLTAIRVDLLDAAEAAKPSDTIEPEAIDFYCSLAQQCFINEYVFAQSATEIQRVARLRDTMTTRLCSGEPVALLWPIAIASYLPLHSVTGMETLSGRTWPGAFARLLLQQVAEPAEEHAIGCSLPALTAIGDGVSELVQHQYELNPYPRWVKGPPSGKRLPIDALLHSKFPTVSFRNLGKGANIDVLVAGCGTGQESIGTAQELLASRILAIDLSRASLAFAQRKTRGLGINAIEYAQADIMKLGQIDRRFDVITSGGVLHHLAEPLAGWRVLLSLLRPSGFMRVGLYSELGRKDLVIARDVIAAKGYSSTADDIRSFRQIVLAEAANPAWKAILASSDFFSTSNCRDLLFHVQEHRFTLRQIQAFLAANDLAFLGFELPSHVYQQFRRRFRGASAMANLDDWHVFETEHPETFAAMYQFWVQASVESAAS